MRDELTGELTDETTGGSTEERSSDDLLDYLVWSQN